MLAHVLRDLGSKSAMVVNGYGGLDELTITGPNRVSYLNDGEVTTFELDPREYDFAGASINDLLGGDAPTNAKILRDILSGDEQGAKRDVTLLNAGAALMAAGKVDDLRQGIELARESIDSGAALKKLEHLIEFSQGFAQ